ncbi:hypothetical protein Btru_076259 [Bulinus truncatus]|nr:hypothetical protein Btru_076259 [Bulinus truncatus]
METITCCVDFNFATILKNSTPNDITRNKEVVISYSVQGLDDLYTKNVDLVVSISIDGQGNYTGTDDLVINDSLDEQDNYTLGFESYLMEYLGFLMVNPTEAHVTGLADDSLDSVIDHNCASVDVVNCTDLNNCTEIINCECKPGWAGLFCQRPCDLSCVHGTCMVIEYLHQSPMEEQFCECSSLWEGQLCGVAIVDSEDDRGSQRKQRGYGSGGSRVAGKWDGESSICSWKGCGLLFRRSPESLEVGPNAFTLVRTLSGRDWNLVWIKYKVFNNSAVLSNITTRQQCTVCTELHNET